MTELQERDLKQYVSDVESMVITTIDQRVIAILSQDILTRARKARDADANAAKILEEWRNTPYSIMDRSAPPAIQHYSHTVPMHTIAKLLMDLSDNLKNEIKGHLIPVDAKKSIIDSVSIACDNFDKEIRNHIIK